jgi:hypothetical protein
MCWRRTSSEARRGGLEERGGLKVGGKMAGKEPGYSIEQHGSMEAAKEDAPG